MVSTFNPAPVDELARFLAGCSAVVTVEAHVVAGGLGAQVAEVIAERGIACKLRLHAVRTPPDGHSGSQAALWRKHGLDRTSLAASARSLAAGSSQPPTRPQ